MKDQKKTGVIISYFNLVLSILSNFVLTPMIIYALGDDEYSIYKVMQSFAGPLIMFNLGMSTIVARAIVHYKTLDKHDLKEKQNTLAIAMITSLGISFIVAIIGVIMCLLIPTVYGNNYSAEQIGIGQKVFVLFVFATIFHILTDVFNGCCIGNERFAFNAGLSLIKNLFRIPFIVIALKLGCKAIVLTSIDCGIALLVLMLAFSYSFFYLKERPKLTYISKKAIAEMLTFSAAILLQAIVNQVNNNVDTMLLGAMVSEKQIITMYSSALVIYGAYNSIVSVMVSFFLPKATKLITQKASGEELTQFVIKPGRYQAMIATAIVIGFALFGQEFIGIWIGKQYTAAYYVVLILIVPVTIPLVENTAISILDASLKRLYRSIVLTVMAVLNIIISIVLIHFIGFWGAALGTFLSLCIGHIILMNIYYYKTFGMKIKKMFFEIFKGILPVGITAGILCIPLSVVRSYSLVLLLIKGAIFILLYFALVWKYGMNNGEREYIGSTFKRIKHK